MARPFYETEQDRINEENARIRMAVAFNLHIKKVPISYGFDFAVFDLKGALLGCIEYKRRNLTFVEGKTKISLSVLKYMAMKRFIKIQIGLKAKLIIECNNGFYSADILDQGNYFFSWGGRVKTQRDAADMEPMVFFDPSCFKKLELG